MRTSIVASIAIPIAYWIAGRVLQSDLKALGVTGIITLLPELMINVARVGNESLSLVCYTAMLAVAVMTVHKPLSWRGWLLLGATLGSALLTKAYVLTAVPAVSAVAVVSLWSGEPGGMRRPKLAEMTIRLAVALAITAVIAGRWYCKCTVLPVHGPDKAMTLPFETYLWWQSARR